MPFPSAPTVGSNHSGTSAGPLSDGCVRQPHADARDLWNFAEVGRPVVVLA